MITIIGAGNFGSALQRLFSIYAADLTVHMTDRQGDSDRVARPELISASKVVIPAVPISQFESVLRQIAPLLSPETIVVDVCTIKEFSEGRMKEILPEDCYLIASHPLFGPESLAAAGWQLKNLNLVIWPTRIPAGLFQKIMVGLKATGLNIIEKSPADHDRTLARSQFLSLLIGAALVKMDIQPTPMNTRSFDELLDVKATTCNDYHILLDVFRHNHHCDQALEDLDIVLMEIRRDLLASRKAR